MTLRENRFTKIFFTWILSWATFMTTRKVGQADRLNFFKHLKISCQDLENNFIFLPSNEIYQCRGYPKITNKTIILRVLNK